MTKFKHLISSGCLLGVLLAGSRFPVVQNAIAQSVTKVSAPTPIPFKPDPPPAIDGDLGEWTNETLVTGKTKPVAAGETFFT